MATEELIENKKIRAQMESVGITEDSYRNLPQEFKTVLENGGLTPLVTLRLRMPDGSVLCLPAKMQVSMLGNGSETLLLFPIGSAIVNDLKLPKTQMNLITKGKTVLRPLEINGVKQEYLLQLDPETKRILRCPLSKMEEKMTQLESVEDIQLGLEQKKAILEGKPMKLDVGGESVVVGVDLRQDQGFKLLKGDMDEWKRQRDIAYDTAHPEYIGLVQTEENRWEFRQFMAENFGKKDGLKESRKRETSQKI